jgi:hypothetical protein
VIAMPELFTFFFQPPVLVLFALGMAGLCDLLQQRSDYRIRVNMEWRVRELFYRQDAGFNDASIARARQQFYERHFLPVPKRKTDRHA